MGLLDGTAQQAYYQGNDHGNYQFVSLADIINQFMVVYVGEDKIITKAKRMDVAFHAQRALAELSFDTFKSIKAQEITVPSSLQMALPHDYVNYTKISWVDSVGIKHLLYPTTKTSNPTSIIQNAGNGIYSPIISGFNAGFTTDETNITYGTGIAKDVTNNQVDFSAAAFGSKLTWGNVTDFEIDKSYVLTYTISNVPYTDPASLSAVATITPRMNDAFGNKRSFTSRSSNGTYTETVTIPASSGGFTSSFWFNVTSTATFTGSISNIVLAESSDIPLNVGSATWAGYQSGTLDGNQNNYQDDVYWPLDGSRYGLDPQHAQANGSFYIDSLSGKIYFSSNISGQTVILDYISDSLGTDGEMQVHKFAEEAMYKWIAHAILSGKANIPEYQVNRFKKERWAAIRTAKLRLSNIKLEELTQILRGKSKQIKH